MPPHSISHGQASVFFGNPSTWGPTAERFVSSARYHLQCIAEHHLSEAEMKSTFQDLRSKGVATFAQAARPTGRSNEGTHCGVAIFAKKHLAVKDYAGTTTEENDREAARCGARGTRYIVAVPDFIAVEWILKGVTVVVAVIY